MCVVLSLPLAPTVPSAGAAEPRIWTSDLAPSAPEMSLRFSRSSLEKGRYGTSRTITTATLSPELPAMPTTAAPDLAPDHWTIVPEISRAVVPPVPKTMSAEIRKRRLGLAADTKAKKCLATAIYFEARGEPKRGQAAVAQVILNRVSTRGFPKTICGVVYQGAHRKTGCQFSFTCDGKPDRIVERNAWTTANRIANEVLSGRSRIPELVHATHYHARYVSPYWAPKMKRLARIGQHIFYDA